MTSLRANKLNSVAFEEYVENDGETCLVIFSRKSCHVCQGVHAVLEDLEGDYNGKMPFYEVDVEEEPALFEKNDERRSSGRNL